MANYAQAALNAAAAVQRTRLAAYRAERAARAAWWPLSWLLWIWALEERFWADYFSRRAERLHARVRDAIDEQDNGHRRGRRRAYRDTGGR